MAYRIMPFILAFIAFLPMAVSRDVVINEVMASNATTIADEDGDHEDWIELFNRGQDAVSLAGYGLSDDYGNPFRWVFPDVVIEPGAFLLVWASGKDRRSPDNPLHTNFSIKSDGEEVLITHPDGERLDELAPIPIPSDISYGRKPDGDDQWFFFAEPTPGAANTTQGTTGILGPPLFSVQGGFHPGPFELEIEHPDTSVTIVYTTDGSEPCISNLGGTSYQYKNDYPFFPDEPFGDFLEHTFISSIVDGPLLIADRTEEPDRIARISATVQYPDYLPDDPVFKGRVVRARAWKDGMLPSDIITHSYFVSSVDEERFSLPVVSLTTQENHLFDYNDGIYTPGVDADRWRENNPHQTFPWPYYGNFRRRGDEWEYPAHLELFEHPGKERVVAQNVGIRIHGGATRSYPNKSLRLYARNQYGDPYLVHNFFGGQTEGYKRLILRNSGNDFPTSLWRPDFPSRTMFRDAAIQAIMRTLRIDTQEYRPAVLFINGEYWGIMNIRERYDKHYLHRKYGVDEENIDLLTGRDEVKEGDNIHYNELIGYMETYGVTDQEHYDWALTRMDEKNFIDYQIANIFADNTDWPGNNIDYWRLRTGQFQPDAPYGHDGRWRWMLFDMDFGFGLVGTAEAYRHNTLDFATTTQGSSWPNPPWSTFLLRTLLENKSFRNQFVTRFADLLNTAFLPERTTGIIARMQDDIDGEIEEHFARWGYPDAYADWLGHVDVMTVFAEERPFYQRRHIMEHFGYDGMVEVELDVNEEHMGYIRINTIDIEPSTAGVDEHPYPWQGLYFKGVPVEIEAIPEPGHKFSHWEGASGSSSPVITLDTGHDINLTAHFILADEPILIHYWLFDTGMPNNTPLEIQDAFYSLTSGAMIEYLSSLVGYPYDEHHQNWRKASMERRNAPTPINYRPEGNNQLLYHEVDMRGLQVRQPFRDQNRENTMILHLPSTGFSDLVLRFAAKDEGAAGNLIIDYQVDANTGDWITTHLSQTRLPLKSTYQLYEVDFRHIQQVITNPDFRVRIRFDGDNMQADEGDRVTFNNISLDGVPSSMHTIKASAGANGTIYPSGIIKAMEGEELEFLICPAENHHIEQFTVDGADMTGRLEPTGDGAAVFVLSDVRGSHRIHVAFAMDAEHVDDYEGSILVYPNPASERISIAAGEDIKSIQITTLSGQLIYANDAVNARNHHLKVRDMRNGMYILIVGTATETVSEKIQIMH